MILRFVTSIALLELIVNAKLPYQHPMRYFPFTNQLQPSTPLDIMIENLEYIRENNNSTLVKNSSILS